MYVIGLEFNRPSTQQIAVCNSSSQTLAFQCLHCALYRSFKYPPKWGSAGRLNCHSMGRSMILSLSTIYFFTSAHISFFVAVKFEPSSETINLGILLFDVIRLNALRNEPVSIIYAISRCVTFFFFPVLASSCTVSRNLFLCSQMLLMTAYILFLQREPSSDQLVSS